VAMNRGSVHTVLHSVLLQSSQQQHQIATACCFADVECVIKEPNSVEQAAGVFSLADAETAAVQSAACKFHSSNASTCTVAVKPLNMQT
jgi:hypothetical protein